MQVKASETITENIFRAFYGADMFIEKSAIPSEYGFISKKGSGMAGYPDFFKDCTEFAIIVEAKATRHDSAKSEVCFYMENNNLTKDSIGIAVSGQTKDKLKVSYFLHIFGGVSVIELDTHNQLMRIDNIVKLYKKQKAVEVTSEEHLTKTLRSLNNQFHDDEIVRDTERSLFFSGIMIALKDMTFRSTYNTIQEPSIEEANASGTKMLKAHILNEAIISAINRQLKNKINNLSKEYLWESQFAFIKNIDYPLIKYKKLIKKIEVNIFLPFENEEKQDILGRAYKIFLSRAGKVDNKNIILTPDHIKRLMVKLARLTVDDVVLDTCTGSGGFLMEAMETMVSLAKGDEEKIRGIKEEQLIGFEIDPVMFALACSNMFLHGDGRTNLIFRSSMLNDKHENIINGDDEELLKFIKEKKPTKVIINPPYENNKPIKFTLQALRYLENNGKLIIIMPTPTLTHNQDGMTEEVLSIAKLDYVIRMPERLFSEQDRTVNTSIFGFTKTPHNPLDMVLYYDLSEDGYVSVQHRGRIDKYNKWGDKESTVLDAIFNSKELKGISEKRPIYNKDNILNCAGVRSKKSSSYEMVKIGTIFNMEKGKLASESCDNHGEYDFITASEEWKKHTSYSHDCEGLVFAVAASGSLGRTHYVHGKFIVSNLCVLLTPKDERYKINLKFYKFYFDRIREQIRADLADGTSKLTISAEDDLMSYYIEYIPYDEQNEFYEKNIKPYEDVISQAKKAEHNLYEEMVNLLK